MRKLMALMLMTAVTACDRADRNDIRAERDDRLYREAMDDYRAGRIDAAIKGFEKVVRNDPANASARFQLACLQQDSKRDFLGAYCGYKEFLLQHPTSDKARLAKDRIALCEKEVATALSAKYGLGGSNGLVEELEALRRDLAAARSRAAASEKNLEAAQARTRSLLNERERLLAAVKGADSEDVSAAKPSLREAKDLLEEDDESASPVPKGEIASLKSEAESDLSSGSALLPPGKPRTSTKPALAKDEETAEKEPSVPAHPKTYEVQEGDTLYGIARRFYGTIRAGKRIREANKALISTDGRVRVGDVLTLP